MTRQRTTFRSGIFLQTGFSSAASVRMRAGALVHERPGLVAAKFFAASLALVTLGCSPLTREEAAEAVEEAKLFSQAATLFGNTVHLNSEFTIGDAVAASAKNLKDFLGAELPCAEVTLDNATLTIEYGVHGECTYQGMTFSGTHEVTLEKATSTSVSLHHKWTELTNGTLVVSGTADVTWQGGKDPSRRIVHDLKWTRLSDGREASGTGDRTQKPLDGDLTVGFSVDGDAQWKGKSGEWSLSVNEVEMRWRDPVPQSGEYVLETPFDKNLVLSFVRTSPTNIRLKAESGGRSYESDVKTVE